MANVANTPRDQEERRLRANVPTITERARGADEKNKRPDLNVITSGERARDGEEARLANGQR